VDIGVLFDDVISSAYDCSAVWKKGFEKLICIGLKLGFSIGEMETNYFMKWNKNIERQVNGY
jgi:dimeric dUTPase (all-alpha-NTP-PPase superfamily)